MQAFFLLSLLGAALPRAKSPAGAPYFSTIALERPSRWRGFVCSAAIHVLVLLFLPALSNTLSGPAGRQVEVRQQRVLRTLHIRIPDELFLAASPSQLQNRVRQPRVFKVPPAEAARILAQSQSQSAESRRRGRRHAPRRRFELAPLPRHDELAQTILQPQFGPDVTPKTTETLPEVFFWTPQIDLSGVVKPYVAPGHINRPERPQLFDHEPSLASGNGSAAPARVPPMLDPAQLSWAVAPPPGVPIRTFDGQVDGPPSPPADPIPGDPTTLLSLSLDPPPIPEYLAVPAGNVVGQQPETGVSGALSNAGGAGGGGSGKGENGGRAGANASADAERRAASEAAAASAAAEPQTAVHTLAMAAAAASRVLHPAGGVFDVVIQSGGLEGLSESSGALSGRPIYSVYVKAGAAHDWILQYCIPAEDDPGAEQSGSVVRLGNPAPLSAPYPTVTTRPPVEPRPGGYVMVHGYVTPEGLFSNLRVLGRTDPEEAEVVTEVLDQWRFRPASRQGQPVRVEILLAIPAE